MSIPTSFPVLLDDGEHVYPVSTALEYVKCVFSLGHKPVAPAAAADDQAE